MRGGCRLAILHKGPRETGMDIGRIAPGVDPPFDVNAVIEIPRKASR